MSLQDEEEEQVKRERPKLPEKLDDRGQSRTRRG